ncbi:MAG: DUF2194 domain-containing protein [Oscillospiraceae bacterium]|nr:DUF2194 domain-containing protein [Oscillospiraceae bacterium]
MEFQKMLKAVIFPIVLLLLLAVVLLIERFGIKYTAQAGTLDYLPESVVENKPDDSRLPTECMLLVDSSVSYSVEFYTQMKFILESMSVGYDFIDIRKTDIPDYGEYNTVVLCIPDFAVMGSKLQSLFNWVNDGGRLFLLCPIEPTTAVRTIIYQIGVVEMGGEYIPISGLKIKTDFMIGSKNFTFNWGIDAGLSAVTLRLSPDTIIHVVSDESIPLLWERECGKGRVVVNHLSLSGKQSRGYYASAYSLLDDAFAYPVINSSTIFIDDFPSPLPSGFNPYINKFNNRDTESFFTNVWWPDMMSLAKQYGLKYTGLLIETYNDETEGPFERNAIVNRYSYFGRMLLGMGGEIGLHGYNHQPICFKGFDYKGKVDYNLWENYDDALSALNELKSFSSSLFKNQEFSVYVPPSNIISEEGQKLITDNFPNIKTISGIYIKEDIELEQEFCVTPDGIINYPRVIAGADIDSFDRWIVFNELSFHYVNSHFIHPDDVLDPERGADKGWSVMLSKLTAHVKWIDGVAPSIRKLTASDGAKAIQRYNTISVKRTLTDKMLKLDIDNFYDSAYFIVRIKDGKPGTVVGGSLDEINTGLYILSADSAKVEISIVR